MTDSTTTHQLSAGELETCQEVATTITGDVVGLITKLLLSEREMDRGELGELRDIIQHHLESFATSLKKSETKGS